MTNPSGVQLGIIPIKSYGLINPLRAFENLNKRGNATDRSARAAKKAHANKSVANDGGGFMGLFKTSRINEAQN